MLYFIISFLLMECKAQNTWNLAFENENTEGKIKQLHIIFRNGHNEPWQNYPEDIYIDIWTIGPGELTILGKRQAYFFGKNLRERYGMLIPETQAWLAVEAKSSPTSRCLMSSAVVLAGFIPPAEEDRWCHLLWQPVAIRNDDNLAPDRKCERYEDLVKANDKKQTIDTKLYNHVMEQSGTHVKVHRHMMNVYNNLEIIRQAGLDLPFWANKVLKDIRKDAVKAFREISVEATRLKIGGLLKMIIDEKAKPINFYCTSKEVIGNILSLMKFNITEPPNFMSAIVIEFRESRHSMHAQLWYRNGPNDGLVRLPWPGCGIRCPLLRLKEILDPYIPEDFSMECTVATVASDGIETSMSLVLPFSLLIIVAGFFVYGYGSVRCRLLQKKVLHPSVMGEICIKIH